MSDDTIDVNDETRLSERPNKKILIVTRVHNSMGGQMTPVRKIIEFVKELPRFCDILICVGVADQDERTSYLNDLRKKCKNIEAERKFEQNSNLSLQNECKNHHSSASIHILDINPWGSFTHALNVAVGFGIQNSFDLILFMSLELQTTHELVQKLAKYFEPPTLVTNDKNACFCIDDTLVVGSRLPGHDFYFSEQDSTIFNYETEGQNQTNDNLSSRLDPSSQSCSNCSSKTLPLRGRTCPWNTIAMWDISKLAITGFPLIADGGIYSVYNEKKINSTKTMTDNGLIDDDSNVKTNGSNNHSKTLDIVSAINAKITVKGGVEEVSAISLLQKLHPEYKAILIDATEGVDYKWNTVDFKSKDDKSNELRREWHKSKMESKDERPRLQMQLMGIPMGKVYHLK